MQFKQESELFPIGIVFIVDLTTTITLRKGVALELALKLHLCHIREREKHILQTHKLGRGQTTASFSALP